MPRQMVSVAGSSHVAIVVAVVVVVYGALAAAGRTVGSTPQLVVGTVGSNQRQSGGLVAALERFGGACAAFLAFS
jgi:hypothetical protein